MDETVERVLVSRAVRGEAEAFSGLVDIYQGPLFRTAYRLLGDREDARDVTQAAFLKAYDKLETYDTKYRFFSWIYRILVNESLNLLGKRRSVEPLTELLPSENRIPDEECDAKQIAEKVQQAIRRLTPDYRTVIVLKYFADMSYREICDVLDLPAKTVKSRLFTARCRLLDSLAREGIRTR